LTEPLIVESGDPCPLCEGTDVITEIYSGEEVCTGCGCVLNDVVLALGIGGFKSSRTDSHTTDTRRHGSGSRQSIFDRGLNTFINGTRDAYGTPLSHETIQDMRRLQRQDNRSKVNESTMRNLSVAMAELDRLTSALNLTVVVKEDAAVIYRRALKNDMIRGRSIDSFIAASLYAACRILGVPRPLKTVADESKRSHKEVSATYRMLLRELGLKIPLDNPLMYVSKLAHILEIPRQTELHAIEILGEAKKVHALTGKDPRGVAAAALYLASELAGERVVQRRVAKAAETTEVTLRNRYRGLKKALSIV